MPTLDTNRMDFSGDNYAQKQVIIDALRRAYEPPPEGSAAPDGWSCVAHLVMHWLKHPETVPQPPANYLAVDTERSLTPTRVGMSYVLGPEDRAFNNADPVQNLHRVVSDEVTQHGCVTVVNAAGNRFPIPAGVIDRIASS